MSPADKMHATHNQSVSCSGAWQIFLYNWHFYAAAFVLDLAAVPLLMRISPQAGIRIAIYLIATLATFWALSSLLVSHYVYDRSQLYQWKWLAALLKNGAGKWANIHAGLDQTSDSLIRLFPSTRRRILDIYLPSEMSEPSIRRARHHAEGATAPEKANPSALPLEDCECDTIFLIFVAHELRRPQARLQFFREIHRALTPGGRVVLVEHLRDWNNVLAYGPGALHFFSERQWHNVCIKAGLYVVDEFRITPFVRCFVFAKRTASEAIGSRHAGTTPCG